MLAILGITADFGSIPTLGFAPLIGYPRRMSAISGEFADYEIGR